jgi:phosphatidylglycerol:prolipoprotein diacylglycerol transferase
MFPYLYSQATDGDPLHYGTYGLMLVLAFLLAAVVSMRRFGKVGVNPDFIVPLLVVSIISAIFGARLLHFLGSEADRAVFLAKPWVVFDLTQGGMAVMGGVGVAVLAGIGFAIWRKQPVWKVMDIAAPAIFLGQAIGRVGCFFAGCCHGLHCEKPVVASLTGGFFPGGEVVRVDGFPFVAFVYHRADMSQFEPGLFPDVQQAMGSTFELPLYPVQSMETLGALLGFALLSWMWMSWRKFDGQIMGAYFILYAGLRYLMEEMRGDAVRGTGYTALDLSTSQVTSIAFVAAGLLIWGIGYAMNRGVKPEQEFTRSDEDLFEDDDLLADA